MASGPRVQVLSDEDHIATTLKLEIQGVRMQAA